jgi:mono/diheme cytochrome c family protein
MKRLFKWIAVVLAVLTVSAATALFAGVQLADRKMQRSLALPDYPLAIPGDAQNLARGRYLYATRGCTDCHGVDGAGRDLINDGKGFHIKGPNISPGPGNVVAGYTPADWERVVRHGVARGGRPLMVMPSEDYARLTDADLGALIAYVRSLPPVAGSGAIVRLPTFVRVLYGFGAIKDAAAKIDHALPPQTPVPEGVTVEHGKYVANMCVGCHGAVCRAARSPAARRIGRPLPISPRARAAR